MIAVVNTGAANLASVLGALCRVGAEPVATVDADQIARASHVVLPGVGHIAAGMAALRSHRLVGALRARVDAGAPTLGICLGLQLLATSSDEDPSAGGIGAFDARVERLSSLVRVPHLGWSALSVDAGARTLRPGTASFAHSYALRAAPRGWTAAWAAHGDRFVAGLERGRVLALQFHPELSGSWGTDLLRDWLGDASSGGSAGGRTGATLRRVIACLDCDGGRVVKGTQFAALRDRGDPAECAARYAADGADEIVMLDVSATVEARNTALSTVRDIRRVLPVPLTVGGGIRSVDDARRLLDAGADKVAVNSAAVARPALVSELSQRFGAQCVVLAVDARRVGTGWEVLVRGGRECTGRDAVAWIAGSVVRGAGEVLLTSWDRDGTGKGYDLELVAAVARAVRVPVIASGGAAHASHLVEAFDAGADAALVASIVHDGSNSVRDLKASLAAKGVEVRQ